MKNTHITIGQFRPNKVTLHLEDDTYVQSESNYLSKISNIVGIYGSDWWSWDTKAAIIPPPHYKGYKVIGIRATK